MMLAKKAIAQCLRIYNDMVVFGATNIRTKSHAHHAVKFILSKDSEITVVHQDKQYKGKGVIIKPDVSHQTQGDGSSIFIYFDPESEFGRQLISVLKDKDILTLENQRSLNIIAFIEKARQEHYPEVEITEFLRDNLNINHINYGSYVQLDERIINVTSFIKQNLNVSMVIKKLTAEACLSESRLFHLFKKEIGIPIRKYILWCRIRKAIHLVLQGQSLTQAAQLAGFSDIAHLNRTFVYFFGISPSHVIKQVL